MRAQFLDKIGETEKTIRDEELAAQRPLLWYQFIKITVLALSLQPQRASSSACNELESKAA
jgi:hypothetical protein